MRASERAKLASSSDDEERFHSQVADEGEGLPEALTIKPNCSVHAAP